MSIIPYTNDLSIFHYNQSNLTYKSINVNSLDDNSGVFFTISEGTKKTEHKNRITMKLNKMELAYMIRELDKIYNKL